MGWQTIITGLTEAFRLIISLDKTVLEITLRSLYVAALATLLASIIGVPISLVITMKEFPGKKSLKFFFNTLVGIPTVTLGLFLYILFSKSGPLGTLNLLYTVRGIAIGQAILVLPILITFVVSAIESKDMELRELVRTLGASEYETSVAVVREAYDGVSLALVSSFNRAFAELGIATMLGANIRGVTRVLTTAIALETDKGELGLSFALSFIMLFVVFFLNYFIARLQGGSEN
ncbi:ABC transporter permease subunit [Candidatus Bathyarchaeota archaeon]|nr:MAG: ABC transporter permease subunit [Candidatus Bathyarchaeota archaeon]